MAQLAPDCATQMNYYVSTESGFCVLSDQRTVIGVSKIDHNTIIKQSITDLSEQMVTYNANSGWVYTLGVDESQNILLPSGCGCNYTGQVVQYDLSTGQVVKAFDQVGINSPCSSIKAGNIWFFGGYDSSKFAVINSVLRQVLCKPVESAILSLHSMTVCRIQEESNLSRVLLFTFGMYQNYSENNSDVFDITSLVNKYSDLPSNLI